MNIFLFYVLSLLVYVSLCVCVWFFFFLLLALSLFIRFIFYYYSLILFYFVNIYFVLVITISFWFSTRLFFPLAFIFHYFWFRFMNPFLSPTNMYAFGLFIIISATRLLSLLLLGIWWFLSLLFMFHEREMKKRNSEREKEKLFNTQYEKKKKINRKLINGK